MCLDSSAFLKPPNAGAIWIPYLESDFHVLPCSLFMSFPQHKMKRWFVINKCFSVVSAQQRNSKVACLHIYRTFTYLFFWMMNLLVCRPQICLNAITECQKHSLIGSMQNGFLKWDFVAVIDKGSFFIETRILKAKEVEPTVFNFHFSHHDWQ